MDEIVHDFNLSVGDEVISCYPAEIVSHIDTIFIGDIARKRFFFEDNDISYLVEGIGSTKGLFDPPCGSIGFEFGSRLDCYAQQDAFFSFNEQADCGQVVHTQTYTPESPVFSVYPNPSRNTFTLKITAPELVRTKQTDLNIYSMDGRLQWSKIISKHEENIELSGLPNGVYILSVMTKEIHYTTKLIKVQ